MLILGEMSSLWQCKYEVPKVWVKTKLCTCVCTQKRQTLRRVITGWNEGDQLAQGEERRSLTLLRSSGACGLWERQSLRTSITPAGCQGTSRMQAGPRALEEQVCPCFPKEGRLPGAAVFLSVLGVSRGGCSENWFGLEHLGTLLLSPPPFGDLLAACSLPHSLLAALWVSAVLKGKFTESLKEQQPFLISFVLLLLIIFSVV